MRLGMEAAASFRERGEAESVVAVELVLGHTVDRTDCGGFYRCYAGLAVVSDDRR